MKIKIVTTKANSDEVEFTTIENAHIIWIEHDESDKDRGIRTFCIRNHKTDVSRLIETDKITVL